jgi:hypothetical protein
MHSLREASRGATGRAIAALNTEDIGLSSGLSALILPVPFPHDFISRPRRRPVAVTIAQRAIDERGKKYQRSKEIHGFESLR